MVETIQTMVYSDAVKRTVVAGMIILGIAVLGYFAYASLRPIAIVGGSEISGGTFRKHRSAFQSYVRAIEAANEELGKTLKQVPNDVSDRAALEELIIQEVIRQELVGIYGSETTTKINTAIDADMAGADAQGIAIAAKKVYGLAGDDFRNVILVPITREKLLSDYIVSLEQDYDAWLRERVRAASVSFPRGGYIWQDGKVVEK